MRGLFVFFLGVSVGVLGVVLALTLDTSPGTDDATPVDVGNARLAVDEDALAIIVNQQAASLPSLAGGLATEVTIRADGLIEIVLGLAGSETPEQVSTTVDPEVVDQKLELVVVESEGDVNPAPEELVPLVQRALEARLVALAGDPDYSLVSIVTLDGRLTLEIEI